MYTAAKYDGTPTCMGCSFAPFIFQKVANSVLLILQQELKVVGSVYLDDGILVNQYKILFDLLHVESEDLNHWTAGLLHMMALANVKVPVTNEKGEYLHKALAVIFFHTV